MFRIGASYKLKEMRKRIGNFQLQQVFPQVGKEIVCALLDKKHNPKAPDEVLVGIGPRMSEKAKRLAREGTGFRVFIKRSSDLWKYGGQYHVSRILEEGDPEGRRVWMQRGREDEPGIVLYLKQVKPGSDERPGTRYFTHYWTNRTWEKQRAKGYEHWGHTAGNQFRRRGVEPSDFIYVITVRDGSLLLGGMLKVGEILNQDEAKKRLDSPLWVAEDHIIAQDGSDMEMNFDRAVSTDLVRSLRFIVGDDEVAPLFKDSEKLDTQTMRNVRELTSESAQLLETVIFSERGRGGARNGKSKPTAGGIKLPDLDRILVEPPLPLEKGQEGRERQRSYLGRKVDHAARDAANRDLGQRGEAFVAEYEREALKKAGRPDLASQVRRISETEGDGAGYDVLSFDRDGREKYIEVKTTTGGKTSPFIVTINEVEFSEDHQEDYRLYRVFNVDRKDVGREPGMFILKGSLRSRCNLEAVQFRASF